MKIKGTLCPKDKGYRIFLTGAKPNLTAVRQVGHEKIAFVLLPELKPAQKNQFGFLSIIIN
jgi:hypothetical protein